MSDRFSPSDSHWTMRNFTEKVTKSQLQDVLMGPDPIVEGRVKSWEYEKLGPDVYEIWIDK